MPPARYMQLTPAQEGALKHLYRRTDNADVRSRCQMILLSAQGHNTAEIAGLTLFDQDTVLFWFDRYEAEGLTGLQDHPRSGPVPEGRLYAQVLATPRCTASLRPGSRNDCIMRVNNTLMFTKIASSRVQFCGGSAMKAQDGLRSR